jgi:formylglycine-generating enzyme required for sulfatase activity
VINGSFDVTSDIPDQWGEACSANGLPYVTGAAAIEGACNVGLGEAGAECETVLQQMTCAPTFVDSLPECTSPSGAADMIGNVAEWVLSCAPSDGGPETECQTRGGSFADSLNDEEATCYGVSSQTRETRDRTLGVRCCAALTVEEQNLVN